MIQKLSHDKIPEAADTLLRLYESASPPRYGDAGRMRRYLTERNYSGVFATAGFLMQLHGNDVELRRFEGFAEDTAKFHGLFTTMEIRKEN